MTSNTCQGFEAGCLFYLIFSNERCERARDRGWYSCSCYQAPQFYAATSRCSDPALNVPFATTSASRSSPMRAAVSSAAISFLDAAALAFYDLDPAATVKAFLSVALRQGNGSFLQQDYERTGSTTTASGTIANLQSMVAGIAGVADTPPLARTNLLAELPGVASQSLLITRLGSAPYSLVTIGDNDDLSVTNGPAANLFQSPVSYRVNAVNPVAIGAADFNGDGRRDIAALSTSTAAASSTGAVSLLFGNGNGTLGTATVYPTAERTAAMTVFDFNRDGRPDIATLHGDDSTANSHKILLYFTNANGTLASPTTLALTGAAGSGAQRSLVAADFTGDGHADLMTLSQSKGLLLLRGDGAGGFTQLAPQAGYSLPSPGVFLITGDYNKDQKNDVAVLHDDGTASVLRNAGDGSFPNQSRFIAGTRMSSGTWMPGGFAMDFNDDGNPDLVLGTGHPDALHPNPTSVTILYGRGDGTFRAAPVVPATHTPGAMAAADFNNDRRIDLITAGRLGGPAVLSLARPGGGFQAPVNLPGPAAFYNWIATIDHNGDSRPDVVATDGKLLALWLGNGDGTFQARVTATATTGSLNAQTAALGNLNGDSRSDAVVAFGDRAATTGMPSAVSVLLSTGNTTFAAPSLQQTGLNTVSLALADINADGRQDLVAANYGYRATSSTTTPTPCSVTVHLGRGDGSFQSATAYTVGVHPSAVSLQDVNKDGKPDLTVATVESDLARVAVLLGRGDGTFQTARNSILFSQARRLLFDDFDGDGAWDLALIHLKGDRPYGVLRGKGDGTFHPEYTYPAGYFPVDAATFDFNSDCRPDIVTLAQPENAAGFYALFENTAVTGGCATTTVATNPPGRTIVVDGATLVAPQSFPWTPGTSHTVAVPSPQMASGTRYPFSSWSDGAAATRTITAPSSSTTYTANFTQQHLLTTAASPAAGGSVSASPSPSDRYYDAGASAQLTAVPAAGYVFTGWTGDATGSTNPLTVAMTAPRNITASFAPAGALYTVSGRITRNGAGVGGVILNLTGGATRATTTDANGNYSFSAMAGGATYTITPTPGALVFSPPSITLAALSANRTADFTAAAAPIGLRFVPIAPCRIMETRALYNFEGRTGAFGPPTLNAAETRTLLLPQSNVCPIPAHAKAYVVNVTIVPAAGGVGFATLWAAGEPRPNTWTIRSPDGQTVANSAIVKAGTNGGISLYVSDRTDLLLDISGYYTDSADVAGLVYYPLTPCRVIDTRALYRPETGPFGPPSLSAQQTRRFRFPGTPYCSVPAAAAYSVTLTVVPPAPLAFL
ncbi:MAG: VCBS repeat-containing protein, partial [Bryobacterales bacterium]|nr:VCBS repeat-containing protein [Bryobacterales bacterium]